MRSGLNFLCCFGLGESSLRRESEWVGSRRDGYIGQRSQSLARMAPNFSLGLGEGLPNIDMINAAYLEGGFSRAEGRAPKQRCPSPKHSHGSLMSIQENS